jgi:hypothetical protein
VVVSQVYFDRQLGALPEGHPPNMLGNYKTFYRKEKNMKNIKVSEAVWNDLVEKAEIGEDANDVLMHVLGIKEAIDNMTLEEIINEDPDFLRQFLSIQNGVLHVNCSGSTWTGHLCLRNEKEIINEAADCIVDALFVNDSTGGYQSVTPEAQDVSEVNRQAARKYINRYWTEYYFERQLLNNSTKSKD